MAILQWDFSESRMFGGQNVGIDYGKNKCRQRGTTPDLGEQADLVILAPIVPGAKTAGSPLQLPPPVSLLEAQRRSTSPSLLRTSKALRGSEKHHF